MHHKFDPNRLKDEIFEKFIRENPDSDAAKYMARTRGKQESGVEINFSKYEKKLLGRLILKKKKSERVLLFEIRAARIIEMRLDKQMTLEEIAVVEGVTRERIRQILTRVEKVAGVTFPHQIGHQRKRLKRIEVPCDEPGCSETIEVTERGNTERLAKGKKKYCEVHKVERMWYGKWARKVPGWKQMTYREQQNWKYHNDPGFKARHSASVRKWMDKQKREKPEEWKAQIKKGWDNYKRRQQEKEDKQLAIARKKIKEMGMDKLDWSL